MKILADRNIKTLFYSILLLMLLTILASVGVISLRLEHAVVYMVFFLLCMGAAILAMLYRYFMKQNKRMENAVMQIKEYASGNQNSRIECDEEGETYRLFHEVNVLVSILNAHAEHEKHAKKFLKDTISDISHQLKTPLAALNVYNGIIQGEEDMKTVQEFAELSEQELDRIETLVQNLLKIAKLDAGTIVLEKTAQNIADMMEYIEKQFSYRARQEGKKLQISGEGDITLLCDRNWLVEAVSNLVKNAFDHTRKGNTIQIEWSMSALAVKISIQDNGSGIHPEDLYHIFKRFYRSRFSKDTKGVGLGLPLAKAIIEAHGGTIEVSSEAGRGSTFTMNFLNPTEL